MSLIIAVVVGGIIVACLGYKPLEAYRALFKGAFGSGSGWVQTFAQFTPVMFTALAYTISMKAGICNLGAEGQFLAGAMGAALAGVYIPQILPYPIGFVIPLIVGVAVGIGIGAIVAALKYFFNSDIMLISLMFNYVLTLVTNWMAKGPFQGEGVNPTTAPIDPSVYMPLLKKSSQLSIGFFISLAVAIVLQYFLYRTSAGFEFRVVGSNPKVARYNGISSNKILTRALLISGGIAGAGGAVMVLGVNHNFIINLSPGYGWDGVAASLLGGGEPLTTGIGAFIFGAMRAGSVYLGRKTSIPADFISVIEGILIIFIVTPNILKGLSLRNKKEEMKK